MIFLLDDATLNYNLWSIFLNTGGFSFFYYVCLFHSNHVLNTNGNKSSDTKHGLFTEADYSASDAHSHLLVNAASACRIRVNVQMCMEIDRSVFEYFSVYHHNQ